MARKKLTKSRNMTDQRILKAYHYAGSIVKAAKILRISHSTVHKVLRRNGIAKPAGGGFKKGHYYPAIHTSCMATYLRRHPTVPLPRSPAAIAYITGCSAGSVKAYLYRMRKQERKLASELPNLCSLPIVLISRGGEPLFTNHADSYELRVDDYDFRYLIRLTYGDRIIRARISREGLLKAIADAEKRRE